MLQVGATGNGRTVKCISPTSCIRQGEQELSGLSVLVGEHTEQFGSSDDSSVLYLGLAQFESQSRHRLFLSETFHWFPQSPQVNSATIGNNSIRPRPLPSMKFTYQFSK
jgi:hypothetical protein